MSPTARRLSPDLWAPCKPGSSLVVAVPAWHPPARIGCAPGRKAARAHWLNQGGAQGEQGFGGDKWSGRASPRDR